jgi:methyltransferase (TIGR00027 family)
MLREVHHTLDGEERMREAVQRGVRQSVILGAGFDTFAYRQPDWARGLRIYEVDHRGTQREKRQRLERAGIPIPGNLEFVAVDFESVSLCEGLRGSSLDFSQPTFFSCLQPTDLAATRRSACFFGDRKLN